MTDNNNSSNDICPNPPTTEVKVFLSAPAYFDGGKTINLSKSAVFTEYQSLVREILNGNPNILIVAPPPWNDRDFIERHRNWLVDGKTITDSQKEEIISSEADGFTFDAQSLDAALSSSLSGLVGSANLSISSHGVEDDGNTILVARDDYINTGIEFSSNDISSAIINAWKANPNILIDNILIAACYSMQFSQDIDAALEVEGFSGYNIQHAATDGSVRDVPYVSDDGLPPELSDLGYLIRANIAAEAHSGGRGVNTDNFDAFYDSDSNQYISGSAYLLSVLRSWEGNSPSAKFAEIIESYVNLHLNNAEYINLGTKTKEEIIEEMLLEFGLRKSADGTYKWYNDGNCIVINDDNFFEYVGFIEEKIKEEEPSARSITTLAYFIFSLDKYADGRELSLTEGIHEQVMDVLHILRQSDISITNLQESKEVVLAITDINTSENIYIR